MFRKLVAASAIAVFALTGAAHVAHAAPVQPIASPAEDQRAMNAFSTQFGIATSIGGFGGTTAGAIIGCAVGGIVTVPTVVFVPVGCLTGAMTGAALGGVVGTIVVGGPALIVSGSELIAALTAAPGTTKWAPQN